MNGVKNYLRHALVAQRSNNNNHLTNNHHHTNNALSDDLAKYEKKLQKEVALLRNELEVKISKSNSSAGSGRTDE